MYIIYDVSVLRSHHSRRKMFNLFRVCVCVWDFGSFQIGFPTRKRFRTSALIIFVKFLQCGADGGGIQCTHMKLFGIAGVIAIRVC